MGVRGIVSNKTVVWADDEQTHGSAAWKTPSGEAFLYTKSYRFIDGNGKAYGPSHWAWSIRSSWKQDGSAGFDSRGEAIAAGIKAGNEQWPGSGQWRGKS